jgi:hypothetical protein
LPPDGLKQAGIWGDGDGAALKSDGEIIRSGDVGRNPSRLSEKLVERHWQWFAGTCC